MNLIRYEPWATARSLNREIDRLFRTPGRPSTAAQWVPAVDIREDADRFMLLLDVPGVDPKDIEIAVENSVLSLSGNRQSDQTDEAEGYRRVERISGHFLRRFTLPDDVDAAAIAATSKNGVLEISIPKSPQAQPRRVEIAVS